MNDRTQLAGMILAGMWAYPGDFAAADGWKDRHRTAVAEADRLLAALGKTQKPETAEPITTATQLCPRCGELSPEPQQWGWLYFYEGDTMHAIKVARCPQLDALLRVLEAKQ